MARWVRSLPELRGALEDRVPGTGVACVVGRQLKAARTHGRLHADQILREAPKRYPGQRARSVASYVHERGSRAKGVEAGSSLFPRATLGTLVSVHERVFRDARVSWTI